MSFDPSKPVQTRNGQRARILTTDLAQDRSIAAAVYDAKGDEYLVQRFADGRLFEGIDNDGDLVNAPERIVRYANVYSHHLTRAPYAAGYFETESEADEVANIGNRIGMIRLVAEGDILKRVELV